MPEPKQIEKNQTFELPSSDEMRKHAAEAAGVMKALGNESRLMIL